MENKKAFIMTGVVLSMLLAALDQTIVSTAMPQIVKDLNGLEHLSWVFTAYMLASTVIVPIYGKLSDLFGPRRFFLLGIFIFLVGSILSGLAQNMTQLICFRAIQGLGGGAIMVNAMATIGHIFPPQERGKWQGMLSGVFGLASIVGPLLGGWITDHLSWRWTFYVNLPVGLIAFIVIAAALPKITENLKNRSIDYLGALLLALTLIPLLLGLVWGGSEYAWDSKQIIGLFVFSALTLILFIFQEKRALDPILSLDLFKNRIFLSSIFTLFLVGMGMFGAILFIPLFAQGVTGISATNSGLVMTPMMIALIFSSIVGGQIISRTGKYKLLALLGIILATLGILSFSTIGIETTQLGLFGRMVLLGLGLGTTMPIFTLAVQNAFPPERLGEVTAGTQLFRSIGGTVGTAIFGGVMNAQLLQNLQGIENHSFVKLMQILSPTSTFTSIDPNAAQGFLNAGTQEQITSSFSHFSAWTQTILQENFSQFLKVIKSAFSASIDHLFLVGAMLMVLGIVAVLFLPEIALKKIHKPSAEETGVELNAELVPSDKRHSASL